MKAEVKKEETRALIRHMVFMGIIAVIGGLAFMAGIAFSLQQADAGEPKVIYPKKTDLDFNGMNIDGQVQNPGEFYFKRREQEKFDSLVKRRSHFHREMLRDAVLSK
jgi:hypothetical protein